MSVKAQKRAEHEARKAQGFERAESAGWQFGYGQSIRGEQAEIRRAQIEGRAEEYTAAQAEARAREEVRPPKPRAKRVSRTASPPARNLSPLPSTHGDPNSYGNGLLADYARGVLVPVPVTVPDALPDGLRTVAEFAALMVGLRLAVDETRHVPLGGQWVAAKTGLSRSTAARALGALVQRGVLTHEGHMPRRGRRCGTALYGIPSVTEAEASDGVPDAQLEPGTIPVETEGIVTARTAVEPPREAPDERSVRDAVGRPAAGPLDGMQAIGDGAARVVVGVHVLERYDRPPTPQHLLERALARDYSPRDGCLWLACQLRDHDHDEWTVAYEVVCEFAARQPVRFTTTDACRILSHAYGRPPRRPWASRKTANVGAGGDR